MKASNPNVKKILPAVIIAILLVVVAIKLVMNKQTSDEKANILSTHQPVHVDADTLKNETADFHITFPGTFEPYRESKISAEIQGKVQSLYADAGDLVREGDPLVQLDNSLLKLQLSAIDVQIEGFTADVTRFSILAKEDAIQGVQLEKAVLALRSAEVQRSLLLEQINKTTIRAPFAGIITAKLTELGAFAAPGVPLFQLTDLSQLKFTINVPESDIVRFHDTKTYRITTDIFPADTLNGKLVLTGSKSSAGNTFPVQFLVNNTADMSIRSGMFGKVVAFESTSYSGIMIPASLIVGSSDNSFVYVVKNNKALLQPVSITGRFENLVAIGKGLSEGDIIVTSGLINLKDGAPVEIKQ